MTGALKVGTGVSDRVTSLGNKKGRDPGQRGETDRRREEKHIFPVSRKGKRRRKEKGEGGGRRKDR